MTDIAAKIIDWRSQMSALQPHLEGLGGVIQVRLGNDSPGSAFARALRFTMKEEGWPFPWSCVQIDYENASTHYVSDIVRQIRKTAGLVVEASDISRQVTIDVGKDIKARGNVDIHDVNIAVESNQDSAVQFESYIQRLCDALRQELTSRRIALLFMNSHEYSRAELARMRRTIWDGALDGLVD